MEKELIIKKPKCLNKNRINDAIEFSWAYALNCVGYEKFLILSDDEKALVFWLPKLFFFGKIYFLQLVSILKDFNLEETANIFFLMMEGKIPSESHFNWNTEEDIYLFYLQFQNIMFEREISFLSRSKNSCLSRLKRLRLLLESKKLFPKGVIPEIKFKCNNYGKDYIHSSTNNKEVEAGKGCQLEIETCFQFEDFVQSEAEESYQLKTYRREKAKKEKKFNKMKIAREAKTNKRNNVNIENIEKPKNNVNNLDVFELIDNRVKANCNKRYLLKEKDFWENMYMFGKKPFCYLSSYMNGPCVTSVKQWIKDIDCPSFDEMVNIKKVKNIIQWWIQCKIPKFVNISVDALKVDEDLYITSKGEVIGAVDANPILQSLRKIELNALKTDPSIYLKIWNKNLENENIASGLFIVIACPLDETNGFPVHLIVNKNGSANDKIDERVKMVAEAFKELGSDPIFLSSDSDKHYRKAFNEQFEFWTRVLLTNHGTVPCNFPNSFKCNDGAHILKRARSQLIRNSQLFATSYHLKIFNSNSLENIDAPFISPSLLQQYNQNLLSCWFRNNGRDSMDDFYPLRIFHPKILETFVNIAIDNNSQECTSIDVAILYLLPMCILNCIIHSKNNNRETVLNWAYVGMFIMLFYWSWLKIDGNKNKEQKKESFSSVFTMDLCVDAATHLFAIILALQKIPEKFNLSKIGTITNEHFNALLRYRAGKEQTIRSMKTAFRKVVIMMKHNYSLPHVIIQQREFRTAKMEPGTYSLPKEEVIRCQALAYRVLRRAGIHFPRESAFYALISFLNDIEKMRIILMIGKSSYFQHYLMLNSRLQQKTKIQINIGTYMHLVFVF